MNRITSRGICYDLECSPYKYTCPQTKITYFFSSKMYKIKFVENYDTARLEFANMMKRKIPFDADWNIIADICFYEKTEKRGFLIEHEGVKIWQRNLVFGGVTLIKRS